MAFGVRPIKVPIVGVDKFSKVFNEIGSKVSKAGAKLGKTGAALTRNVTLPIVAAGTAILATAGSFESSMNEVAAISGATGADLKMLTERAREMGAATQFSASEAAKSLTFLSMAGLSTQEAFEALPGTLELAAAAGTDLGTAADIATNLMTPFGMKAQDLTFINDVLANTFTKTNTTILQLAEGMKFVAPIAGVMGIKMEEVAAAMGLLGNAGIQGTMAGTTLRRTLSRLAKPSAEAIKTLSRLRIRREDVLDSEGNVRSLESVIWALETAGASATDMMAIFGEQGGPGMAALVSQGSAALAEQTRANLKSGKAAEIAEKRMKGLFGELKTLRSAAEELAISIGEAGLLSFMTKLAGVATDLVRWMGTLSPAVKRVGTVIAAVAAAIGPVLVAIASVMKIGGFLAPVLAKLTVLWGLLAGAVSSAGGIIGLITNPIGWVIAAILSVSNAIRVLIANWTDLTSIFESKFQVFQTFLFILREILDGLAKLHRSIPFLENFGDMFEHFSGRVGERIERNVQQQFPRTFEATNNARVEIEVKSDGVPVRATKRSGRNVSVQTDTGMVFAGG